MATADLARSLVGIETKTISITQITALVSASTLQR